MLMMEEDDTLDLEAHQVEIDPDFEPQSRPRSCTWPLPHPDDFPGGGEEENRVASSSSPSSSVKKEPGMPKDATGLGAELNGGAALEHNRSVGALSPAAAAVHASLCGAALDVAGHLRKTKSSRRNAWGNQSYADLITRAIESTAEKRLTLSQIYDWMVRYVPYFKDKGDSNSSAGWKNSIRHNLSLHTRFIRVQNEGTGKSSWWMLNPDGGKSGKAPRRRAVSMDNNSKFLKSKGRASKKKAAAVAASAQEGPEESPGRGAGGAWSPAGGGGVVAGGVGEEFDAWTDIRSRASSSASTLSSRLSPILAADDDLEPEDGPSCSASPRMYPSPSSTLSPNVGTGGRCPVELPQLADLTGAINLNENLNGLLEHRQDSYAPSHQQMKQRASGFPFHGSKCAGTPSSAGTYCGTIYSQSSMGMLRHSPMQTIQENKPTTFQAVIGSHYPSSTSLQDLLTSTQQYRAKALMLSHEVDSLMPNPAVGVTSHAHSHSHSHTHRPTLCSSSSGSISRGLSNGGGLMQAYNNTSNSLKVGGMYPSSNHSHLPTSTTLPPNPAGLLGAPLDTCHLATAPHQRPHPGQPYPIHSHHQGMADSIHGPYHPHPHPQGNYHYHSHLHHHYPPERLPADLDLDMFHGSLDCDVESIILNDFMDSSEEIDFNFDCALSQGNMGMAMGMGNLPGTPQTHNNQSWVPG